MNINRRSKLKMSKQTRRRERGQSYGKSGNDSRRRNKNRNYKGECKEVLTKVWERVGGEKGRKSRPKHIQESISTRDLIDRGGGASLHTSQQ